MADIRFEEDQYTMRSNPAQNRKTFLVKMGIVQDETAAQKAMLAIIVLSLVATVALLFWINAGDSESGLSEEELRQRVRNY